MSTDGFFDQFARTLAEPMPRRRAVRVLGASLAALAVPGVSPRMAQAATIGASDDIGPTVCPGKTMCSTYIDPNNWAAGQKHKCCPFPMQQWKCGPNWTCVDGCAATGKLFGKKYKATWSTETMGGTDPNLSARPKRYECCPVPDTIPKDGECLPNCPYQARFGGAAGPVPCGKTCCATYQLCVNGECQPCEKYGGHTCEPPKGRARCCKKGTTCCFNETTTACCGPNQTCRAHNQKRATCLCEAGTKKCGSDCCEKGETCCGGKECCAKGETCTLDGCCPKDRAVCRTSTGKNPRCCDEGDYCLWKADLDAGGILTYPLRGTCKKGCAPGNQAGTQCCGTGYKPNSKKTACVPG